MRLLRTVLSLTFGLGGVTLANARPTARANGYFPAGYRDPTLHGTKATLTGLGDASVQYMLSTGYDGNGQDQWAGTDWWLSMSFWTAIIDVDFFSGRALYADNVAATFANIGGFINAGNDDTLWWGIANLRAYRAYGGDNYLQKAIEMYQHVNDMGFISADVVEASTESQVTIELNGDTVVLPKECNGKSLAGGVLWQDNAALEPYVNSITTGLFAWLGAELCDLTKDDSYCDEAEAALAWLQAFMLDGSGLVMDGIHPNSDCGVSTKAWTYNSGVYIAAWAKYANVRQSADAMSTAQSAAIATMSAGWHNSDGVITEAHDIPYQAGFKGILMRGLSVALRLSSDNAFISAVGQYSRIQYYGAIQASDNESAPKLFDLSWGSAYAGNSPISQGTAIDVLAALHTLPDADFATADEAGDVVTV